MRRTIAVLAMVAVLVVAHLVNTWFAQAWRAGIADFQIGELRWFFGLLPLLAAAAAVGLGWFVLHAPRPDAAIGLTYVVIGLTVVFATPVWLSGGWAPPDWFPVTDLLAGQALAVWEAAAIAVIGLAELVRSVRHSPT
jgi:hypothetical protein